jgi:dTDP-4-dehydrorhamnose 3,5-epimerase
MTELKLINGGVSVDDRGTLRFVNDFHFEGVQRFYHVENYDINYIRAWHGHKIEGKYVYVCSGSILIGVVDMKTEELTKYTLSALSPKVLYIPPGYYNGFQTLEYNTKVIFFSTSSLSESIGDDIRERYDKWNIWEKNYR